MKFFIAILALVAVAAAVEVRGPRTSDVEADTVEQYVDVFPDKYLYRYRTSNGISAQESGYLKNVGTDNEGISVEGANSYTNDEGQLIETKYIADENGYQPQGAHIPTPWPIPEYIARAIAYNLANAKAEAPLRPL